MMAVLQDSFSNSTPALFTTTSKPPNRAIVTRNTSAKNKTKQETSVKSGKKHPQWHIQGIRAASGEVDVIVCMNFKHFLRIKKDTKNGHMLSHCKFI